MAIDTKIAQLDLMIEVGPIPLTTRSELSYFDVFLSPI
jgi:hypothetical protein